MEAVNVKIAELLRKVLIEKGDSFSKLADERMPFDRPTPEEAIRSGQKIRLASVALPVFRREGTWCISLMKRTEYPGVHSGQVSIPGGEVEPQDGSRLETAIREFREEMGVELQSDLLVAGLSDRYIPPSRFAVSTFIAVLQDEPNWRVDQKRSCRSVDDSRQGAVGSGRVAVHIDRISARCKSFLTSLPLERRGHLGSYSDHFD